MAVDRSVDSKHGPETEVEYDSKEEGASNRVSTVLRVGVQLDVLDNQGCWCEAEVLKVDRENKKMLVTYLYWESNFDEWISNTGQRIAPLHQHTYFEGGVLKKGQRIEALDTANKWLEAQIVEESTNQVKVHYKGWHCKFDEWIDRGSSRIRPYGRSKPNLQKKKKEFKKFRVPGSGPGSGLGSYNENLHANSNENQNQHHTSVNGYGTGSSGTNYTGAGSSSGTTPRGPKSPRRNENFTTAPGPGKKAAAAAAAVASIEIIDCKEESYDNDYDENNNNNINDIAQHNRQIAAYSDKYRHYISALEAQRLHVVSIPGDGNCLFRSVAHQVYGDDDLHMLVRQQCMDYMEADADFFSQFVEGGLETFPLYLRAKRLNACWGDDPEIQAMCEIYNRPAEIWAYDSHLGARKLRTFHEAAPAPAVAPAASSSLSSQSSSRSLLRTGRMPIRLSYYGGGHYDSVVDESHAQHTAKSVPGEIETAAVLRARARDRSRLTVASSTTATASTATVVAGKVSGGGGDGDDAEAAQAKRVSDEEATEQAAVELAIQRSRNEDMHSWEDDLESCLIMSLEESYAQNKRGGRGGGGESTSSSSSSAAAKESSSSGRDRETVLESKSSSSYKTTSDDDNGGDRCRRIAAAEAKDDEQEAADSKPTSMTVMSSLADKQYDHKNDSYREQKQQQQQQFNSSSSNQQQQGGGGRGGGGGGGGGKCPASRTDDDDYGAVAAMDVDVDVHMDVEGAAAATDSVVLRNVARQSELEYLETAILSSLQTQTQTQSQQNEEAYLTEEALLRQATIESMRTLREQEDAATAAALHADSYCTVNSNGNNGVASASAIPSMGGGVPVDINDINDINDASVSVSDPSLALALKLSTLTEDEALELALRQSMEEDHPTTTAANAAPLDQSQSLQWLAFSSAGTKGGSINNIATSRSADASSHIWPSQSNNNNSGSSYSNSSNNDNERREGGGGGGGGYVNLDGSIGYDDEEDEDLMRAIAESLKK